MAKLVKIGEDEVIIAKAHKNFVFLQGMVAGIAIGFILCSVIMRLS